MVHSSGLRIVGMEWYWTKANILSYSDTKAIQLIVDVKATKYHSTGLPPEQGDDPTDAINHMMSFLSSVVTSRCLTTNNQLRNSSNPRQQDTINEGRVTLQPVQGRQISFVTGTSRTFSPGASEKANSGKQRSLEPKRYDGDVIKNTSAIVIPDPEETLNSMNSSDPTPSYRPPMWVQMNSPKVSMVNTKFEETYTPYLAGFDVVVKISSMATAIKWARGAQSQEKDMVIKKLKERIKSLSGNINEEKVKKDIEEIETINIELDSRKKDFVITALKNDLKKLKRKASVDNVVTKHTIALEMLKIDMKPIVPGFLCVLDFINDVNAHNKSKSVKKSSNRKLWKPTGKVFTNIGYTWRPTGQTFTIMGNACPLTRITTTAEVPLRKPTALESGTPKPVVTLVYSRKPKKSKTNVPVSKPKKIKSLSANKKEPNKSWGSIVSDVPSSSLDECRSSKLFSVKFVNNHVEKILGYGDYQIGNVTISRVYYVEGLGHNTIRTLKLLFVNTLALFASKTKSWLWHHLCSACAVGKSKKKPHKPKSEDTNQEKLYLLHMDLCGSMRVASVNGKKYILVIVDDYSRFTSVKCLRSKDEAPDFIIKRIIETIHVDFDELTAMASEHSSSGPALHEMTPAIISSGLV
ncbi:retrovirus-related pol polyprotein from transposon TNT 1-94 [Tanacetum coccineum]